MQEEPGMSGLIGPSLQDMICPKPAVHLAALEGKLLAAVD